ncbi:MAG: amino acid adenylation domain-containing protein [Cyanobacteria bacterium J06623_4]
MKAAIENMYPLSPMQEGLLFHTLLSPTAESYTPQIALTLSGKIDSSLLKQAWEIAIARQNILRTGFYWEQRDQPFQVVYRQSVLPWVEQDWTELSEVEQSAKLSALLECNRSQPFDLNQPPLMRLTWVKRKHERYVLIWCYHHLILDGWSASQLLKQVFQQYFILVGQIPPFPSSTAPAYGNYIAWVKQQDTDAAKVFWKTYLVGWQGPVSLPILSTTPTKTTRSNNTLTEQQRPFSIKFTQKLKAFAQAHRVTLNTLIQATLGLVLSRYCDTPDVVFGATCAGRPASLPGAMDMIGLFINTLPVRVQLSAQATVADWLQSLHTQQAEATDYEYTSLRELQAWVNEGRSLFDCLLVFESYPVSTHLVSNQTDLSLEEIQFDEWTHFPLTLLVSGEEKLTVTAKFREEQIEPAAVSRFLGHLGNVLTALMNRPEQLVRNISLLCSAEKKQLASWNQTEVSTYPLEKTIPDLFEEQARKTPDAIALIFSNQSLTYQSLNEQANQLAHTLQSKGIGPEDRVAVYLERSVEMVIALLAIIKAGATYVPLDPSYPEERIDYMRSDAEAVITLSNLPDSSAQEKGNPVRTLHPDNSFYIIYTSGSTGQPKGVINTHRALVNRLCWMQQTYALTTGQRVLHKTPLSFDVSIWEIFWPLLNGATLVLAKPEGHKDSAYLADLIQTQGISITHFVPSMLSAFLENPEASNCNSLKHVICSGEALPVHLQAQFFQQLPNTKLHNLYGPTEAAIDVTAWQCQPDSKTVLIGQPIANTQIHLLDSDLNPVPVGIPGELHIGGAGLARGYLNRPDLTAERFIPNPFPSSPSVAERSRSYKTGDLARHLPDGTIEYLGRKDNQIKLRGVRIELGEIETALCHHPGIRQAAVIVREGFTEANALVAYFVGDFSEVPDLKNVLSQFLKKTLPDVMIPSAFVSLAALPLTPNGKLDKKSLPKPNQPPRPEKVAPRNETEQAIATIWSTVLQQEDISLYDNFFELGGHSLSATRVNTRLRKHFNLELPLQSLFEYPTLEALSTHIDALRIAIKPTASDPVTTGHKEIEL